MQIRGLHTHIATELRKTDSAARRGDPSAAPAKAAGRSTDSAGISAGALKALSNGDALVVSTVLEASPDLRADRIAQVKKRIAEGFYNTPEFAEELAGKLAGHFGVKQG